jgi:hypothetical protein
MGVRQCDAESDLGGLMNSIIHSSNRGMGQDGNTFDPLHLPSTGIPSAQGRAGLPVARGTGFNWGSMHAGLRGLGQDDSVWPGWDIISKGLTTADTAYQQYLKADLQSQMMSRGYPYGATGYPYPGQMVSGSASLTSSSMMPILLLGGLLLVVMVAKK